MSNGEGFVVQTPFSLEFGGVFLDLILPRSGKMRLRKSEVCLIRVPDVES